MLADTAALQLDGSRVIRRIISCGGLNQTHVDYTAASLPHPCSSLEEARLTFFQLLTESVAMLAAD